MCQFHFMSASDTVKVLHSGSSKTDLARSCIIDSVGVRNVSCTPSALCYGAERRVALLGTWSCIISGTSAIFATHQTCGNSMFFEQFLLWELVLCRTTGKSTTHRCPVPVRRHRHANSQDQRIVSACHHCNVNRSVVVLHLRSQHWHLSSLGDQVVSSCHHCNVNALSVARQECLPLKRHGICFQSNSTVPGTTWTAEHVSPLEDGHLS